jgi:hypothetical protein
MLLLQQAFIYSILRSMNLGSIANKVILQAEYTLHGKSIPLHPQHYPQHHVR